MPVPLTRKHALEDSDFQLNEHGFQYYGVNHSYEDVVTVGFLYRTYESISGVSIVLVMNDGLRIQLTEQPTLLSDGKPWNINIIQRIYIQVAQKTFSARAKKYFDQIDRLGYFQYAGWKFFPSQEKFLDLSSGQIYFREDVDIYRYRDQSFMEFRRKNEGIIGGLKRKFTSPVGFETIYDKDVIYEILSRYFRVSGPG
jgi:hypothetical protein